MGQMFLHRWTLAQRLAVANTMCLCLGFGLLFLSLAPVFVERIVTQMAPDPANYLFNSAGLTLSVIFLALAALIRRGRSWAVWAAFIVSTLMVACGIAVVLIAGAKTASSFVLVLSGMTCYGTWRAIDALNNDPLRR